MSEKGVHYSIVYNSHKLHIDRQSIKRGIVDKLRRGTLVEGVRAEVLETRCPVVDSSATAYNFM